MLSSANPLPFFSSRLLSLATALAASGALAGCGINGASSVFQAATPPVRSVGGALHGGQQPVVGAQVFLYAAGRTGIASGARSMLSVPVFTDGNGNFNLTPYTCNAGDQVYLVGLGGNSGAGVNPALALMAAIGPCATFQANAATTFVNVNEVTTVAAVFALAPYMSNAQNVGADAAHLNALAAAMASAQTMASTATGTAPQTSTGQGIVPQAAINSLANSLAACVNSAPAGGGQVSTACANLFSAVGSSTPGDTVQATLAVALNPAANPSAVFSQATAAAPFQPTLQSAPATYALAVQHPSDVLIYHNDAARTGVQPSETILTPGNISATHFGKIGTFAVDSYLFAQPLYVGGVGMPDGAVRNLLLAASTHGTVYAFDADGNNPAAGYLWSINYIPAGERFPTGNDYYGCSNPPEAGIVGTPVIDRGTQTLYVLVKSISTNGATFTHRLHAVSLIDGSERPGSPVVVAPTFTDKNGVTVPWSAKAQNERSALLMTTAASGARTVWIDYASHCDQGPYHGIVVGYNASTLALSATFNDTPNGYEGGLWGSNGGVAADPQGNIYALAGNGTFDANTGGVDYGDSAIKLVPPAAGAASTLMSVADSFTPYNQQALSNADADLGGAEPLLFNDPASGIAPNLMVATDKNNTLYLINTDTGKMGGYTNGPGGKNNDVQEIQGVGFVIWNLAFFNNIIYTPNPLRAYQFVPGTATTAGHIATTPLAGFNVSSAPPVVSANGTQNALVWASDGGGVMHVFTPTLTELYNTQMNSARDAGPTYVKFTSPVVANGKVYLSGQGSIAVYGLLP